MKKISLISLALLTILCLVFATGCEKADGGSSAPSQFQSSDLSKYVIVYPDGNSDYYDLANKLADHILQKYGIFPIPTPDALSAPGQYEIILGDTNRYEEQGKIMEYSITVDDGKLRIMAGGPYSAEQAVDSLCKQLFTGREFAIDEDKCFQASFLDSPYPVSGGATARIMTANILADAFADSSYRSASYRAEIFAGMLVTSTPDILGLQETDADWNNILDTYLAKIEQTYGISYARHQATYEDKVNYTSLLYRRDKFQVSDSGVYVFNWWTNSAFNHDYHMRNITWAQFTPLESTEKSFIVADTHWSYRTEHSDGNITLSGAAAPIAVNELRTQCKDETNAYLSTLRQTYAEIPIILVGDFNTSLPFFTDDGWTPTSFNIISQQAQNSKTSRVTVPTSNHFDHMFGTGSYTIALFDFLKDSPTHKLLSDHPFVFADFNF